MKLDLSIDLPVFHLMIICLKRLLEIEECLTHFLIGPQHGLGWVARAQLFLKFNLVPFLDTACLISNPLPRGASFGQRVDVAALADLSLVAHHFEEPSLAGYLEAVALDLALIPG